MAQQTNATGDGYRITCILYCPAQGKGFSFRVVPATCVVGINTKMPLNGDPIEEPDELLLLRYLLEETDPAESESVETWVNKRSENKAVLSRIARLYHAQQTHRHIAARDAHKPFERVRWRIRRKARVHVLKRVAVAASLLIGLSGIGSLFLQRQAPPAWITVYTKNNLRNTFDLPDGTTVQLNSSSSLSYPVEFTGAQRPVKLVGEAYFKVAHHAKQPFVVRVADDKLAVKVLGTEFTVSAYAGEETVQTTLIAGSIEVEIPEAKRKEILKPDEMATFTLQRNELRITPADVSQATDWMYNKLVFRETSMGDVLKRLARFYDVRFEIRDDIIYAYTFTGSFENKPLNHVLDYMKISSKIDYSIRHANEGGRTETWVELRKKH